MHHTHSEDEEAIYVLEGQPPLFLGSESAVLKPGSFSAFPSKGEAHHVENNTFSKVVFLEFGTSVKSEVITFPEKDAVINYVDGKPTAFNHLDGTPI